LYLAVWDGPGDVTPARSSNGDSSRSSVTVTRATSIYLEAKRGVRAARGKRVFPVFERLIGFHPVQILVELGDRQVERPRLVGSFLGYGELAASPLDLEPIQLQRIRVNLF